MIKIRRGASVYRRFYLILSTEPGKETQITLFMSRSCEVELNMSHNYIENRYEINIESWSSDRIIEAHDYIEIPYDTEKFYYEQSEAKRIAEQLYAKIREFIDEYQRPGRSKLPGRINRAKE